ncbi:hypothetical protein C9F11_20105 [Streptomyces sp. YIM 121038]|uniref:hypothetical protein n=1 Tax=Streptomyces sp. YIM 121038 TaxID=2136401 RepID=UPI0011100C1D|nr:hypothetical protein [Streptomyces sp. YIM 121038]QCX77656.1 hypothetical protein C9F11_20105 [Streptomyces sp. YIM 121038]
MGTYNPDTDTIWSTTHSGFTAHAFNSEGRALCNRSIRPRSDTTIRDSWNTRAWYEDGTAFTVHARCVQKLDAAATQAATVEQTAPTAPAAPRSGEVTIPGALADHLADTNLATGDDDHDPASKATREALDAGRRGRGRTLIIKPMSTDVLNVISEYADALLGAEDATAAERRAAQKWTEQAGHARKHIAAEQRLAAAAVDLAETAEQAETPADESESVPGTLVDPWTWIRRPASTLTPTAAQRAERRQQLADSRSATAYPLAVAAVRQVVREMSPGAALRVRVTEEGPETTLTRDDLHALAYSGHTTADAVTRVRAAVATHIRHGEREVHIMFPALGMRPTLYLPDVMALLNRWKDAQAAAEQALADAEAQQAAALVTETEASEGTWRGEWIGEQPVGETLFTVEPAIEQGALFDDLATAPASTVRKQQRAALDRIKAKADDDRADDRAATDDQIAAHGVPAPATVTARIAARTGEQPPERHVVEGVIVAHNGRTKGTAPKHSADPDALAAVAALGNLRLAEITDHADIAAEPGEPDHQPDAWGFLAEPRGHGRIALYWVESGRYVTREGKPWAVELKIGADRLSAAGWKIEPRTRRCVMAWRPA